jgi:hypothetical protein
VAAITELPATYINDVVHHDIHTSELRPDLGEDTDVSAVDHVRLEELEVRNICVATFELAHVLDLLKFRHDEGSITVALGVDESKHIVALFPAVLASKPSALVSQIQQVIKVRSYLGDSGRKKRPKKSKTAGIICRPHGMRKASGSP